MTLHCRSSITRLQHGLRGESLSQPASSDGLPRDEGYCQETHNLSDAAERRLIHGCGVAPACAAERRRGHDDRHHGRYWMMRRSMKRSPAGTSMPRCGWPNSSNWIASALGRQTQPSVCCAAREVAQQRFHGARLCRRVSGSAPSEPGRFPMGGHQDNSRRTSANFSRAKTRSSCEWAAEICVRMRALPCGTTG